MPVFRDQAGGIFADFVPDRSPYDPEVVFRPQKSLSGGLYDDFVGEFIPQLGPYDIKYKAPTGQWLNVNHHDTLMNVGPDDHHPQLHTLVSHTDVTVVAAAEKDVLQHIGGQWVNRPFLNARGTPTATSPGATGQMMYDDDYLYQCVTTNSWKRVALEVIP